MSDLKSITFSSGELDISPSELSKGQVQTVQTCEKLHLTSNSDMINEETKPTIPAAPALVTLTGTLQNFSQPKVTFNSKIEIQGQTLTKISTRVETYHSKLLKNTNKKNQIDIHSKSRPQSQMKAQSLSISPMKSRLFKMQQKFEQKKAKDITVSPVEINYKFPKSNLNQMKQSVKSDERLKSSLQLNTMKVQSLKSIDQSKKKIEKNQSRKETTNTSNHQGNSSSAEPRYFCFTDLEPGA